MTINAAPKDGELISAHMAARLGIDRLRKAIWANKLDHLKIDIIDGQLGPWIHLYSPINQSVNGCDPMDIVWATAGFDPYAVEWLVFAGPLPDSDEYLKAAQLARR